MEDQQFLIAGGIFIIIAAVLAYLAYFGVLTPVTIHNKKGYFGPRQYLYFNSKMNYVNSSEIWGQVATAMYKHFKFSVMAGLYYDPLEIVEDKDNCRITFGILVNSGEVKKIEGFLQEFPQYTQVTLPNVDVVYVNYPYRSMMSFFFAVKKVYPNLNKYMYDQKIEFKSIMELYDCERGKNIQFLAFYGDKAQSYFLTTDEQPIYKQKSD